MMSEVTLAEKDRAMSEHSEDAAPKRNFGTIKLVLGAAAVVALIAASRFVDVQGLFRETLEWIEELGFAGAIVFLLLYIVACVFFLPGFILTLGAGAIYGIAKGTVLVSVSSTLGATAAFLVGRYLARDWIARKIEQNAKFRAVDEAVAKEGWKIVGLTRLSPIFPFSFLNYAYGLTQVSLRDYFFASWIGMLPGTVIYVYLGSIAGNLANIGEGNRQKSPLEWAVIVVGLLVAIIVTVYVTKVARRALTERVGSDGKDAPADT